jgi:branched-subunit amino acid ABC-type transport system permease component
MDFSIASILMLDGFTNGAVYALLGLATVLVFTVTRVIFIPQGEFVAYGALTLAMLQAGKVPGTVWLLMISSIKFCAKICASNMLRCHISAAPHINKEKAIGMPNAIEPIREKRNTAIVMVLFLDWV